MVARPPEREVIPPIMSATPVRPSNPVSPANPALPDDSALPSDSTQPAAIRTAMQVVDALLSSRVKKFVYAPGSRNAPFAYVLSAYEDEKRLTVHPFAEERGAGFFAVGSALVEEEPGPVAVFTTSGTAVFELHPAVAEASHQGLPLIVVSADRPFEVQSSGASQTTDQVGAFGGAVVAEAHIPALAEDAPESQFRGVYARVRRLIERAKGWAGSPGPAHLNIAFSEPLVPSGPIIPGAATAPSPAARDAGSPLGGPAFVAGRPAPVPFETVVERDLPTVIIAGDGANRTPGLFGCGAGAVREMVEGAARLGMPLLAEPSANLAGASNWVPHAPWLLEALGDQVRQVVVVGQPTLTRPVSRLLADHNVRKIIVSERGEWPDPAGTAEVVVPCLAPPKAAELSSQPDSQSGSQPGSQSDSQLGSLFNSHSRGGSEGLLSEWREVASRIGEVLDEVHGLNHLTAAQAIWRATRDGSLWLGASNPIRAFDLAARGLGSSNVFSNRGLAGIDGVIALGLGGQESLGLPMRVVLGDLTFAYDLPSLGARPAGSQNIQLIVFADGGGTIFSSLEHGEAANKDLYDRFFAVKQEVDIRAVGAACGWESTVISTEGQLEAALRRPVEGRSLLEVRMENPAALFNRVRLEALAQVQAVT